MSKKAPIPVRLRPDIEAGIERERQAEGVNRNSMINALLGEALAARGNTPADRPAIGTGVRDRVLAARAALTQAEARVGVLHDPGDIL